MQNKLSKKYFQAFTLVELIIVITILAVLATIAFVSFSKYTKSSRDATKLTTLSNIEKTLSIHYTQTSNYPTLKEVTLTGIFNTEEIFYQGNFTQEITQLLNISKPPIDPITNAPYTYGVSKNKKYYQLATGLETQISQTNTPKIINTTYANFTQAKVVGNYKGILLQDSKLYNIPSLIVTGTGNLTSSGVRFIVDKGTNLPTQTVQNINLPVQTLTGVLQSLGSSATTLTGLTLPCDKTTFQSLSGTLSTQLGYSSEVIGEVLFGSKLYTNENVKIGECKTEKKSVGDCSYSKQVFFSTIDGTQSGATCNDDIIICNGTGTGYVISACNLGATVIGTGTMSNGQYFQWGNNYGTYGNYTSTSSTLVDASSYGPGNYYYNSTYITAPTGTYDWSSIRNDNLWGNTTNTKIARRGPCPDGYYIPTSGDWVAIIVGIFGWGNTDGGKLRDTLKLPMAGYIGGVDGKIGSIGGMGAYSSSSITGNSMIHMVFNDGANLFPAGAGFRRYASSMRCFKN